MGVLVVLGFVALINRGFIVITGLCGRSAGLGNRRRETGLQPDMRRGTHTTSSLANLWTDDGVCNPVLAPGRVGGWPMGWDFQATENQPGFGFGPFPGYAYSERLLRGDVGGHVLPSSRIRGRFSSLILRQHRQNHFVYCRWIISQLDVQLGSSGMRHAQSRAGEAIGHRCAPLKLSIR